MRYLSMTQQGIEGRPPGVARRVVSTFYHKYIPACHGTANINLPQDYLTKTHNHIPRM